MTKLSYMINRYFLHYIFKNHSLPIFSFHNSKVHMMHFKGLYWTLEGMLLLYNAIYFAL